MDVRIVEINSVSRMLKVQFCLTEEESKKMNEENTKYLVEKYPAVFNKRGKSFHFECGDGWVDLIDKLTGDILSLNVNIKADQIKNKFGALRYYISYSASKKKDEEINRLIAKAESDSAKTCEFCGKAGALIKVRWYMSTLCADHLKTEEERLNGVVLP